MANVLPPQYRSALAQNYALRLVTVSAWIIACTFIIGAVSLVPAYFSSRTLLNEAQQYYDIQQETREVTQQDSAVAQAQFVRTEIQTLKSMASEEIVPFMRTVLDDWEVHAEDIIISSIAHTYDDGKVQVRISGEARNREQLSAFVNTLRRNPAFTAVELPVSDLVNSQETTFSIVVTKKTS